MALLQAPTFIDQRLDTQINSQWTQHHIPQDAHCIHNMKSRQESKPARGHKMTRRNLRFNQAITRGPLFILSPLLLTITLINCAIKQTKIKNIGKLLKTQIIY